MASRLAGFFQTHSEPTRFSMFPAPTADASAKARALRGHKRAATGLFLAMVAVYAGTVWMEGHRPAPWIGYVGAFAEAAMVGALADWFAVTALFHHPLGIPIPHTALIERGKARIGANLGDFVVQNFLTPASIRPYLQRLSVARAAGEWLGKEKSRAVLLAEAPRILSDILSRLDDRAVVRFLTRKGGEALSSLKLGGTAASALRYAVARGEHQSVVTLLAGKVAYFIAENGELVRSRVRSESPFFIPGFVNNKLAEKITAGLTDYFLEIEADPAHRIREEITTQLLDLATRLETDPAWEEKLADLRDGFLRSERLQAGIATLWTSFKTKLVEGLNSSRSPLVRYLNRSLDDLASSLSTDEALQARIDGWVRLTAYRYILRNRAGVGNLISSTVGAWPGKELSAKLELEVGRDLQFIRINGTVVGGLVGLAIYALTQWLG